ncbi:MAG TPA: transglutaminase-like domain-containing protein [Terriglobia bacterium]|nr:transglutaminase-like domain-containing protein [Terriglobia bacterium]
MSTRSRRTFQELVNLPDGAVPLAEAALLLACEEYPQLELSPYLDRLDEFAEVVRPKLQPRFSPLDTIDALNEVLFGVLGFRGNTKNYNDPRNSFFNDVLERRVGIPITLSAVYLEVARRVGFPIYGVGMPGHFLVRYDDRQQEFFVDPFNGGQVLTRDDCQQRFTEMFGNEQAFSERMLSIVSPRQMLFRMLNNLKTIYLKAHTFEKSLAMVDMMLLADPEAIEQYRDRGIIKVQLRRFDAAVRDFEHYVKGAPDSKDRPQVEEHLKELRRIRAMMN